MRIREEILGTKHPDTAQSYHNLAVLHLNTNEHKKALFFFEKALQIQEEFLSEKHPDLARSYYNLSHTYEALKQCHESLKMSKQSINILEKINPSHSNLFKYKQHLKKLENKIEKEHKLPFNKKGRYCKD
jgi:tetratricopeptide (TPR) repeat protein